MAFTSGIGATATVGGSRNISYVTVTATDANGCTASATVYVAQLSPEAGVYQSISCSGGTGKVEILTNGGGTPPYTVTDGTTTISTPFKALFDEKAGTYTFRVTDAHGCTASSEQVMLL